MGKRDVGSDVDLPRPIAWCRPNRDRKANALADCAVFGLNDQHAIVRIPPDCELKVGDLVGFGVSHPCTTFDRWPLLYMIGMNGAVLGGISTFSKLRMRSSSVDPPLPAKDGLLRFARNDEARHCEEPAGRRSNPDPNPPRWRCRRCGRSTF
jgi:hypothetical protein